MANILGVFRIFQFIFVILQVSETKQWKKRIMYLLIKREVHMLNSLCLPARISMAKKMADFQSTAKNFYLLNLKRKIQYGRRLLLARVRRFDNFLMVS